MFSISNATSFQQQALALFRQQAQQSEVYARYLSLLGINPSGVEKIEEIPFVPISFFKDFKLKSDSRPTEKIFESSGTTGSSTSKHYVSDLDLYHAQLEKSFSLFFGDFSDYIILPLLPAYAERSGSSLIEMVDFWMNKTAQKQKQYYLYGHHQLKKDLLYWDNSDKKVILIGVSFALLDFVAEHPIKLNHTQVIETGGMKGRKKEITRQELHRILAKGLGQKNIISEYGMTELLSQAYAMESGNFTTPPWMKIMLRDPEDPFSYVSQGKTGGINVIDLANRNSCAFVATDDLGRTLPDGTFQVLGRFDNSDVRGCNLMVV